MHSNWRNTNIYNKIYKKSIIPFLPLPSHYHFPEEIIVNILTNILPDVFIMSLHIYGYMSVCICMYVYKCIYLGIWVYKYNTYICIIVYT